MANKQDRNDDLKRILYFGDGKAVQCKSDKLVNEFLQYLKDIGYNWLGGSAFANVNFFSEFGEDTCYKVSNNGEVSVGSRKFFESLGNEIVEFKGRKVITFRDLLVIGERLDGEIELINGVIDEIHGCCDELKRDTVEELTKLRNTKIDLLNSLLVRKVSL